MVLFVNGLPLGVLELKNPGDENATLSGAFNQLQTYKAQIPSLFRTNAVLVTSDGIKACVGSLTADEERFMPWRSVDGETIAPTTDPQLETLIKGVLDRGTMLRLLRDFTVFGNTGSGIVKIVAAYHQFFAAQNALSATLRALPYAITTGGGPLRESPLNYGLPSQTEQAPGDKKIGVIWHTQGSGKSLLMAFYAGLLVRDPALENPTIVVITDRNECAAHPERSCAGADKEGVSGILLSVGLAEQKRDHDGQALYCQGVAPVMTTAVVVVSTAELKDFRS